MEGAYRQLAFREHFLRLSIYRRETCDRAYDGACSAGATRGLAKTQSLLGPLLYCAGRN